MIQERNKGRIAPPPATVRMDDETKAEFERLQKDLSEKLGLELSQADVIRLAVRALARENPPEKKAKR